MDIGGGWEAEGGLYHPDRVIVSSVKHRNSHSVHVRPRSTVVGSSLTPCAALLVLPSGTIYPVVDHHEFTGSEKCCL